MPSRTSTGAAVTTCDIGMIQRGRSLRLDFEARASVIACCNLRRQEFDRDEVFEPGSSAL